jgi:hypothetical protein
MNSAFKLLSFRGVFTDKFRDKTIFRITFDFFKSDKSGVLETDRLIRSKPEEIRVFSFFEVSALDKDSLTKGNFSRTEVFVLREKRRFDFFLEVIVEVD